MKKEIEYSIVIPVFNSYDSLDELTNRVKKVMGETGKPFEVILIDDGSSDKSWKKMEEINKQDNRFKLIQLFRNFGQHNATLCGLSHCSGKHVVTLDCDLEHYPEDIPKLLEHKQHDIVIAQFPHKQHSLFKKITSRLKDFFIQKLVNAPRGVQITSFRLFKREVAENMAKIATPYPYLPALMFFISKDVKGVTLQHGVRKYGSSSYSLRRMINLFSNLMINNSSYLLNILGKFGMFCATFGLILAIYLVHRKLVGNLVVPGWTSLAVLLLFFTGVMLISQSIIGEYLLRIINNTEGKPGYIERRIIE